MCGIAGFIDLDATRDPQANDRLADMMQAAIGHRGPDGHAIWRDAARGVWLAHRRLAVVDLTEAGDQPMLTPDGAGILIYNGEIYNAADVRPELEAAGYRLNGHSDTEVLLYACQLWGVERAVGRLGGMFAFAYWDARRGVLTLGRDRLGKKPLYWAQTPKGLMFASELRPLMLHPDCPRRIDRDSVAEFLRTHYVPDPHSILVGVNKLEPGHLLEFDTAPRQTRTHPYWTVAEAVRLGQVDPFRGRPDEAVDETERLLGDAVETRMISDVPLGAFLSGGIDSSLVVAMMQARASRPVRTFSIGYRSAEYDETSDAEAVAAHLGCEHQTFRLGPADALGVIPMLPDIFDEPFADPSQIPTYMVAKLAREHVTVALTGDGGDEVFAGYNRHLAAHGLLARLRGLPGPLRAALAGAMTALPPDRWQALFNLAPNRMRPRRAGEQLHKLAGVLSVSEAEQYRMIISQWPDPEAIVIDGHERPGMIDDDSVTRLIPDAVGKMRYLDLVTYLPGDILTKVDRATMAVSLESRAPLLDHRLVELSWRLPSALHLKDGQTKWILRQILERHVPRAMFARPKSGFGVPIGEWLRGPLRDWAEETISERALNGAGLLRAGPVRALWGRHLSGEVNAQYQLWPVLMLQAWHARHAASLES